METNNLIVVIIIALMLLNLAIGVPLFIVLALGSLGLILLCDVYSLSVFGEVPFSSIDSWALLAMPLFILAGEIISRGRTAKDIVRLSEAIVGWTSGGLGTATIFGCFFFAGTSGSSSADTITIGRIMIPAMRTRGYNASYAASLAASGGILGVIIPPSLIFIIYGISTSTSIGELFIAGIIPGLLIALTLSISNSLVCRFSTWALVDKKLFSFRKLLSALWHAKWGLGAPLIILGGIYGGIFTPTEAAAVAVFYVFLVETVINKELGVRDIISSLTRAAIVTGILGPIIAFSILFGETLAILRVPGNVVNFFVSMSVGHTESVFMIIFVLLIMGCILEPIAAILVIMPILLPIGMELGFDPVHFGVFVVSTLSVGFITPPVGINLFAASAVSGQPFLDIASKALPAFVALIVTVSAIAFLPDLILWFR